MTSEAPHDPERNHVVAAQPAIWAGSATRSGRGSGMRRLVVDRTRPSDGREADGGHSSSLRPVRRSRRCGMAPLTWADTSIVVA